MIFSRLFDWTPMAKRAKADRSSVTEAKAANIEARIEAKIAEDTLREARGLAAQTREVTKRNHFSAHIEELFS